VSVDVINADISYIYFLSTGHAPRGAAWYVCCKLRRFFFYRRLNKTRGRFLSGGHARVFLVGVRFKIVKCVAAVFVRSTSRSGGFQQVGPRVAPENGLFQSKMEISNFDEMSLFLAP
jgi:hypothetical protein